MTIPATRERARHIHKENTVLLDLTDEEYETLVSILQSDNQCCYENIRELNNNDGSKEELADEQEHLDLVCSIKGKLAVAATHPAALNYDGEYLATPTVNYNDNGHLTIGVGAPAGTLPVKQT